MTAMYSTKRAWSSGWVRGEPKRKPSSVGYNDARVKFLRSRDLSMTDSAFHDGPYLSAAFLCEKVLIEKDNVKSAVRILDRIIRSVAGPQLPETMEPFEFESTLFLRFKTGFARGSYQLKVELMKPPPGAIAPVVNQTAMFEGEEERGVDIVIPMRLGIDRAGVYWFRVYLNETIAAMIPFRVIYTTAIIPRSSEAGS